MKKTLRLFFVLSYTLVLSTAAVKVSAQIPYTGAKPSIIPDFGNVYINTNSGYKYFTLFGLNLISDVTVGPLQGYSFSVASDGTYSSSVTIKPVAGQINQDIFVKFSPDAAKIYNSNIAVAGGGAMSFNVAASGTGVATSVPPLTQIAIQLMADDEGGQASLDGARVIFGTKYSAAIGDDDSYKWTNEGENLAIDHDGTLLSIEGRPEVGANDTLSLRLWNLEQERYYLKLTASGFSSLITASIKDSYLNTETPIDLSSTTLITFENDAASVIPNRFSIILKTGGLLAVTLTDIKAYRSDQGVKLEWTCQSEINTDRYEIERSSDGQRFDKAAIIKAKGNNAISQSYVWYDANAVSENNFYRIKVIEKSGAAMYSPVVKVNMSKGSSLTIFPNPVKGNTIGLKISKLDKGNYSISIYNNSGLKVYAGLIQHSGGYGTYSISPPVKIPAGIYSLQINKGATAVSRLIMVK